MVVSVQDFLSELFQEYLEEASFLYEQRLSLLDDSEISWQDLEDFEARFEPHIDGLVVGEASALDICRQRFEDGDFGELHAAMRVFCRQNRWDLVEKSMDALDYDDEEKVKAVSDALSQEFPDPWLPKMRAMLDEQRNGRVRIAAHVLGFRRLSAGPDLIRILERDRSESLSTIIWALGRLREAGAGAGLFQVLTHGPESIKPAVALSLLRMGEARVLKECIDRLLTEDWPILPLGLGGGQAEAEILMSACSRRPCPDAMMALALLGDVSGTEILIDALADPNLADAASMALNLLTGAKLYQERFTPEKIDEEELFEEEIEKLKRGEPLFAVGEEPGFITTAPARDSAVWSSWWKENRSHFQQGVRYRNGLPYSPEQLVRNLESSQSPRLVRQLAYEELVIRYGVDLPFETDMTVAQQKDSISSFRAWRQSNHSHFYDGKWYFAGRIMTS